MKKKWIKGSYTKDLKFINCWEKRLKKEKNEFTIIVVILCFLICFSMVIAFVEDYFNEITIILIFFAFVPAFMFVCLMYGIELGIILGLITWWKYNFKKNISKGTQLSLKIKNNSKIWGNVILGINLFYFILF